MGLFGGGNAKALAEANKQLERLGFNPFTQTLSTLGVGDIVLLTFLGVTSVATGGKHVVVLVRVKNVRFSREHSATCLSPGQDFKRKASTTDPKGHELLVEFDLPPTAKELPSFIIQVMGS